MLYQKLLDEKQGSTSSVDLKQVLQLLEEIRRLREQLDQSIRSNQALSEHLQSRLEQTHSESTLHFTSTPGYGRGTQTTPPSARHTTESQTTPSKVTKKYSSRGTSPHVKVGSRSTSTRVPVSTRSTMTKGQRSPGRTTISLHYDSESQNSFTETKLSDTSTSSLSQPHISTHHGRPTAHVSTSTTKLSDASTSSLSQPTHSPSTTHHGRPTAHVSTSTTTFTSPQDSSTPHTRHEEPLTRTSTTYNTSFDPSTTTTDGNRSSTTSRLTHSKTTTTSRRGADLPGGGATGESPRQQRRPDGRTTFSWAGTGDFASLETRLQEALNSPSLPVSVVCDWCS